MPTKSDYLKKYIKEILLPIVKDDGFQLYRPKELLRVRGSFVDQICFQLSQYGNKNFYVHYHKNLISYPFLNMNGYRVGHRLSNNSGNGDETKWCGLKDKEAYSAITSVVDAYKKTIGPWFRSVDSIPEYCFESFAKKHDASIRNLELAVAFAEAGKRGSAWWICSDILNEKVESDEGIIAACQEYVDVDEAEKRKEALNSEYYAKFHEAVAELPVPETDHDTIDSLLSHWKQENIEKFKLEKFIV